MIHVARLLLCLALLGVALPVHAQNLSGQTINATLQNAAAATGNGTAMNTFGYLTLTYHIVGTFAGTVAFEVSPDNTNWSAVKCSGIDGTAAATTSTTAVSWRCNLGGGVPYARARVSAYTSGAITVYGVASTYGYATAP